MKKNNKEESQNKKPNLGIFDIINNIDLANIEKTITDFGLLYKTKELEFEQKFQSLNQTFEGYKGKLEAALDTLKEYTKLNEELRSERDALNLELEKVKKEKETISEAYSNLFNEYKNSKK